MIRSLRQAALLPFAAVPILLSGCQSAGAGGVADAAPLPQIEVRLDATKKIQVGFLVLDGVYGSELIGPHDVLQHTIFHADPGMQVFTIGRTHDEVRTFEGLHLRPDFSLADAPKIDVLVVPSAEHNLDTDLEDQELIDWVRLRGQEARYVMSLCDGAFVLAQAGLLEGHACTTFPGDLDKFAERFPDHDLRRGPIVVVDRNTITNVGGARSYDPAMLLVEILYGRKAALGIAGGLVLDWRYDPEQHEIVAP
ncbi:MAG: DJ-1/PfpI family protein [Planctomycetota bacterium]